MVQPQTYSTSSKPSIAGNNFLTPGSKFMASGRGTVGMFHTSFPRHQ